MCHLKRHVSLLFAIILCFKSSAVVGNISNDIVASAQATTSAQVDSLFAEEAHDDSLAANRKNGMPDNFFKRLAAGIKYRVQATAAISDNASHTPLWLNANNYGMGSAEPHHSHFRLFAFRPLCVDTLHRVKVGYGLDVALSHNENATFFIQQAYAELAYKKFRVAIGAKERPANLKNAELSTGGQTFGINAHPVPQLRVEASEYIPFFPKHPWLSWRAHIAYGFLTDGGYAKKHTPAGNSYVSDVLYHSKSAFLRIGDIRKCPLVFEGGLEMAGTFGGKYHDGNGNTYNWYNGIKDFFDIFVVSGSDAGETSYKNARGNTVGSWLFSLKYARKNWAARIYYDHFFEDHSALFWEYGWRDALYGMELTLPRNPFVGSLVYEYINTTYQSGAIYHDATSTLPDQISARDNYYNHTLYAGWQHWGQAIGNPLFLATQYNSLSQGLTFRSNRFTAHHIGLNGDPIPSLHYRLLFTYARHLGTYGLPYEDAKYQRSFLAQLAYSPARIMHRENNGWSFEAAFALDRGSHTGDNTGFRLTITKAGNITR